MQNFPSEFALVKLVDVKDLTVLAMDRRSSRGESLSLWLLCLELSVR